MPAGLGWAAGLGGCARRLGWVPGLGGSAGPLVAWLPGWLAQWLPSCPPAPPVAPVVGGGAISKLLSFYLRAAGCWQPVYNKSYLRIPF